ncbi:hypothetical protein F0562_029379 [Nyssa sinensis]|uniref:Uncharacterized protein n=1 Tax=Nyssa sinensis TaxID=561372 RepID=A0A5J5B6V5_9ASTE|nr:hypothetical protein F0562_029379 [Nyssa sinensis]
MYRGLAICHRLFDFIMQMLAAQAVKLVTLGPPVPHVDASENIESRMPCEDKSPLPKADSEQAGATEKDDNELPPLQEQDDAKKLSEEVVVKITVEPQTRAPEKVVSFNENVEEIIPVKKKKKKKAPQKLPSMESEKEEEQIPLKSILKGH